VDFLSQGCLNIARRKLWKTFAAPPTQKLTRVSPNKAQVLSFQCPSAWFASHNPSPPGHYNALPPARKKRYKFVRRSEKRS
jgi:hypothetical protein